MAHQIFTERYAGFGQEPWHLLGKTYQEPVTAQFAYQNMEGEPFRYILAPINASPVPDQGFPGAAGLADRAIFRSPVSDDSTWRYFGPAGPEYVLIQPEDICRLWDQNVGLPMETMAVLLKGEIFFISVGLPDISVAGEEIKVYLVLTCPFKGGKAYRLMVTHWRPVCWNTLVAGEEAATSKWKISHDSKAEQKLGAWLKHIRAISERKAETLRQAFQLFAGTRVDSGMVNRVLLATYPDAPKPDEYVPPSLAEQLFEKGRLINARMQVRREAALELFEGRMVGHTEAVKGNLWGLWNAECELEDRRPANKDASKAFEALLGSRAAYKAAGYTACYAAARGKL